MTPTKTARSFWTIEVQCWAGDYCKTAGGLHHHACTIKVMVNSELTWNVNMNDPKNVNTIDLNEEDKRYPVIATQPCAILSCDIVI